MTRAQRQDAADDYEPDDDDECEDSYDSSDACLVGGRLCYAGRLGSQKDTDDDPR